MEGERKTAESASFQGLISKYGQKALKEPEQESGLD